MSLSTRAVSRAHSWTPTGRSSQQISARSGAAVRLSLLAFAAVACGEDAGAPSNSRAWFDTPLGAVELSYVEAGGVALVEGDIALPLPSRAHARRGEGTVSSAAHTRLTPRGRWPKGRVPYVIGTMPFTIRLYVTDAMAAWESATPVRFVPWDVAVHGSSHIEFQWATTNPCTSPVGREPSLNVIKLGELCALNAGAVMHEIGHSLGLWHEATRRDRDDYVAFNPAAISPTVSAANWDIADFDTRPVGPYDLGSIMHYGGFFGAADLITPVLTVRATGEAVVANTTAPSSRDACAVRRFNGFGAGADVNGDGYGDLVVGVPGHRLGTLGDDAGALEITYGSAGGLSLTKQHLDRSSSGVEGDAGGDDGLGAAVAFGDFDGDCYTDVAVGAPGDTVGGVVGAGSVHVFRGGALGLRVDDDRLWDATVAGVLSSNAAFGAALTAGDFDGDGLDDLAIGAPRDRVGAVNDAGSVTVMYGSPTGLVSTGARRFTQGAVLADVAEANDQFGFSLASGDFDSDGYLDLAVGVPNESIVAVAAGGAVHVIMGSASGLTEASDQAWSASNVGVPGVSARPSDLFGYALTTGDFDGDSVDDLAVGVPLAEVGAVVDAGLVIALYGNAPSTSSLRGLATARAQAWTAATGQVFGDAETSDVLGRALVAGDFDADGYDDLAIGVPYDTVGGAAGAGAVLLVRGSPLAGLTDAGSTGWYQSTGAIGSSPEAGDLFGLRLRATDYDGDGIEDLAIAAPYEDDGTMNDAGVVHVLFGRKSGISDQGTQLWKRGATVAGERAGEGL